MHLDALGSGPDLVEYVIEMLCEQGFFVVIHCRKCYEKWQAVSVDQGELGGMPEPAVLRLHASDGQVLVTWGPALVYRYEAEDLGMRNLAIVALTDAGRRVDEVAAVFGLTATYVSILRGKARRHGSTGGGGRPPGRPPTAQGRPAGPARGGGGWPAAAAVQPSSVTARWPRPGRGPGRGGPSRRSVNAWGVLARWSAFCSPGWARPPCRMGCPLPAALSMSPRSPSRTTRKRGRPTCPWWPNRWLRPWGRPRSGLVPTDAGTPVR